MPYKGNLGATCDQRIELQVSWKVENFFSLPEKVDDWYKSPVFHFLGHSFCLSLYPGGSSSQKSEGWIGLFLRLNDSCPPMEVEYTLGIQTPEGKVEERANFTNTFQEMDTGVGRAKCLKRSDLLIRRQELAPSDALIFAVSMKTNVPRLIAETTSEVAVQTSPEDEGSDGKDENRPLEKTGTTEVAVQTSLEDVDSDEDDERRLPAKTGCEKVAEDLGKLCSSGDNSDVVVKVGDVEFKAHRTILGARTPVLRAMFSHDTEEKESGVVTITDCQPKTFQEFLHYVYTGSPRELTTENAFGLYAVAEKYLVDDLKTQCLQYIRNNLRLDTFCNTVLLAVTHGEAELLEQVVGFAAENIRLIIRNVEWQKFNVEHPTEATEILIRALGPHEIRK